jgi:hypothetical protein
MMATRRSKIARSAVRRVKRREPKNAKLTRHQSRKNARKYSTTAKKNQLKLFEMRGGWDRPEWTKSDAQKRKEKEQRDAPAKAAAAAAKAKEEAAKAKAEAAAEAAKAKAEAEAAVREERKIEEKNACQTFEGYQLLSDSETIDALNEIERVEKYFRNLKIDNSEGKHMFEGYGYKRKWKELKDDWLKTNPDVEKFENALKKLSEVRTKLLELSDSCKKALHWTSDLYPRYKSILTYGDPEINIDSIWEVWLPVEDLPCRYRPYDPGC